MTIRDFVDRTNGGIYISGPMTGYEDHNFPAFNEAERRMKSESLVSGWEIVNPATLGEHDDWEWDDYLSRDIIELLKCQAILVLDGWRQSRGASLEVYIAEEFGMPRLRLCDDGLEKDCEPVVEEARRLVYGQRGSDYGHPYIDYSRTSAIWSAILGTEVTPEQAILCMIGLKISRECNRHKRDNLVDMAGYAECLSRCYSLSDDEKEAMKCR